MRPFVLLASLATVATLGYLYAPRIIGDSFKPANAAPVAAAGGASANANEPQVADDMVPAAKAPVPQRPVYGGASGAAKSPGPAVENDRKPGKKRLRAKKKTKVGVTDDAGLALPVDETAVGDETGLLPAKQDTAAKVVHGHPAVANDPENQLKNRWIDDLSGQKARLTMGRKAEDLGCGAAYSHCERPAASQDLSLVGVVVKTNPLRPMDGSVVRGNYVDHTPALYVK